MAQRQIARLSLDGENRVMMCPRANPTNANVTRFFVIDRPTMKPRNIRFSSWRSKLYVPTMDDGAVVEIDPLTNNVTAIYTGFDCPWDILDTGSQVFAIQLGVVGLKKVL